MSIHPCQIGPTMSTAAMSTFATQSVNVQSCNFSVPFSLSQSGFGRMHQNVCYCCCCCCCCCAACDRVTCYQCNSTTPGVLPHQVQPSDHTHRGPPPAAVRSSLVISVTISRPPSQPSDAPNPRHPQRSRLVARPPHTVSFTSSMHIL